MSKLCRPLRPLRSTIKTNTLTPHVKPQLVTGGAEVALNLPVDAQGPRAKRPGEGGGFSGVTAEVMVSGSSGRSRTCTGVVSEKHRRLRAGLYSTVSEREEGQRRERERV